MHGWMIDKAVGQLDHSEAGCANKVTQDALERAKDDGAQAKICLAGVAARDHTIGLRGEK